MVLDARLSLAAWALLLRYGFTGGSWQVRRDPRRVPRREARGARDDDDDYRTLGTSTSTRTTVPNKTMDGTACAYGGRPLGRRALAAE